VQLDDEVIPDVDLQSAGFDFELDSSVRSSECGVTTRIPTPDMTFASVLYCMVADHLGAGIFSQFREKVRSIENRLPPPDCEALRRSFRESPTHFKSSHWFAHMSGPAQ